MTEPVKFDYRDDVNRTTFNEYVHIIRLALDICIAIHQADPTNAAKFVTAQQIKTVAGEIVKFAERREIIP